jgi:hypothetical protein
MDTLLTALPTLALAVALAASAGLRAWLPLLAVGTLARLDMLTLGDGFAFLSSTPALAVFAIATVLEMGADKVPALDHGLDLVSTFVRPAAGALLAAGVIWQIQDPMWATALGIMVGAPLAAAPHVAKSALRVASTATTGGLANPLVSVIEDVSAIVLIAVAVLLPMLAALMVVVAVVIVVRKLGARRPRQSLVADA